MVQDNPYNPYEGYDGKDDVRFYTKSGLFGAWKARAMQYISEKVISLFKSDKSQEHYMNIFNPRHGTNCLDH